MNKIEAYFSVCLRNFNFTDVHVEGAQRIARIARESGVEKLVHFSSLNASPTPQHIYSKAGSKFLRSKVSRSVELKAKLE